MNGVTPSQTIGPFFALLLPLGSNQLVARDHPGAVTIDGTVFDGAGSPVVDALIEIWQANADGHYNHPGDTNYENGSGSFGGFGRCVTDEHGSFSFVTIKPGRVANNDERMQAPHIVVTVFARGLLRRVVTRVYFPDEALANASDPVLTSILDADVRATLIAEPTSAHRLRFDIHLRGEKETAFFAI